MDGGGTSINAIIAVIGAFLAVSIKFFDAVGSWKKSRDKNQLEKKEANHTFEEIKLIKTWLEAVSSSADGAELESRRKLALTRLDNLMTNYQKNNQPQENIINIQAVSDKKKSNTWFYVMSAFLAVAILGMFVDEEDELSMNYFLANLDTDAIIGFSFVLIVWVYFLVTSSFFKKHIL